MFCGENYIILLVSHEQVQYKKLWVLWLAVLDSKKAILKLTPSTVNWMLLLLVNCIGLLDVEAPKKHI